MTNPIRVLDWVGIVCLVGLGGNFLVSFVVRAFTKRGKRLGGARLRLTWAVPCFGSALFLLTGLMPLSFPVRLWSHLLLIILAVVLFAGMLATTLKPGGWRNIL